MSTGWISIALAASLVALAKYELTDVERQVVLTLGLLCCAVLLLGRQKKSAPAPPIVITQTKTKRAPTGLGAERADTVCPSCFEFAAAIPGAVNRILAPEDEVTSSDTKIHSYYYWNNPQQMDAAPEKCASHSHHPSSCKKAVTSSDSSEADQLMKKEGRSAADCERAASLYHAMLKQVHPKSADATSLRISTADALNAAMRLSTNGNVIMIEGSQDTPEHQEVWARFAPEAAALSKAAWLAFPDDPRACSTYADAAQYEGSTKGLVKQALTGEGDKFLARAKALQRWPHEEAGLGLILEGAFYLVAPWPLKNLKKSLAIFQESCKVSPCRRNLYYLGLAHLHLGQKKQAEEAFVKCLASPPGSQNEADVADYISSQARLGIKKVQFGK